MTTLFWLAVVQSGLVFDAKVLDAVEGGPVTLEVSLKWTGSVPLSYSWSSFSNNVWAGLLLPVGAIERPRPQVQIVFGITNGIAELRPGQSITRRIHLHHLYYPGSFPVGDLSVTAGYALSVQSPSGGWSASHASRR